MKRVNLRLSQVTLPEKLDLLEAILADLCLNKNTLESPDWHEAILKDREESFTAGESIVSDWEKAKERISRIRERLIIS